MIQNFHLNLAPVGVARKRKLDAQLGGAIERIRIVREENIGHIPAHQRFDTGEKLLPLAAAVIFALVIHTDEIELGALESNLRTRLPKQVHPCLCVEISCGVFSVRVDFMIAVAAPSSQRRIKMTNLVHTLGNRIAGAGNELARYDGKIGA